MIQQQRCLVEPLNEVALCSFMVHYMDNETFAVPDIRSHLISKCVQVIKKTSLDYQPGKAGNYPWAPNLQGPHKPKIHCVALVI